jgi:hypothetical protein
MSSGTNPAKPYSPRKLRMLAVGVLLLMQPGCMCGCSARHAPSALAAGAVSAGENCSQCSAYEKAEHVETGSVGR